MKKKKEKKKFVDIDKLSNSILTYSFPTNE